ncbi:MAG: aldehyde ferredoxin oxidoreductase [Desulfitobacterium hafniense]|nr:aldehyde ferredoxin oxidoreductase [Desulfitobacterium hafniense]
MVFNHRILEVNLDTNTCNPYLIDCEWSKQFIGGRGLGIKLLWERLPQRVDPLSSQAEMFVLTGPLTAVAPGGAHTCLAFKSPQTNTFNYSITGAQWGPELRAAGFDGLIITGKSEKPVYLYIKDGLAEFRDASHLWGVTSFQTETALKAEVGDSLARVLCIGPAGEQMIPYASVQQEFFRAAARGGGGAVWGSKNLKAIVVRGTGVIPVYDPVRTITLRREMEKLLIESRSSIRRSYDLIRWGGSMTNMPHSDEVDLNVANYREGYWEEVNKIGGLAYERLCRAKSRGCYGCPLGCMALGVIREGAYEGNLVCPDLEATANLGSGLLVNDLNSMVYLTRWADEQGFDATSLGNVTGFAIECYEKGLLTNIDSDGLALKWGNITGILALWAKILKREGIGELFAKGVKKAADIIGQGSHHFAMQVKGKEFACFTPQAYPSQGLQYAVSDKGPAHHFGGRADRAQQRTWADLLTVCTWQRRMIEPKVYLELLNAVTGWEVEISDWAKVTSRVILLGRAYNIREGMIPLQDDVLPERVHTDNLTQGLEAGKVYSREQFMKDRENWYLEYGCDPEGYPTTEALRQCNLEFVIPVMDDVVRTGLCGTQTSGTKEESKSA